MGRTLELERSRLDRYARRGSQQSETGSLCTFRGGGDIEAEYHRSVDGGTPLKYAVLSLHIHVTSALLQHAASINHVQVGTQPNAGEILLHAAARQAIDKGAAGIVDLLLRFGADETVKNDDGTTAALEAAKRLELEEKNGCGHFADNISRLLLLLTRAPHDRAWRRRGMLVLGRAYSGRMRLTQDSNYISPAEPNNSDASSGHKLAAGTLSATLGSSNNVGIAAGDTRHQGIIDDAVGLNRAARWVVQAGGVFRAIVTFL